MQSQSPRSTDAQEIADPVGSPGTLCRHVSGSHQRRTVGCSGNSGRRSCVNGGSHSPRPSGGRLLSLSRGKLRWRTCFVSISSEHPSNPDPVARRETTAECRGTPDVKPFSCSTPSPTQLDSLENSLGHSGAVGSSVQKYPVTWKIKRRKRKSAWRHKPESTAAKVS